MASTIAHWFPNKALAGCCATFPVPFILFINNLELRLSSEVAKFVKDSELFMRVKTQTDHEGFLKDLSMHSELNGK